MPHPLYCDHDGNTFLPGYRRRLKDTTSYYPGLEPFPSALVQTDVEDVVDQRYHVTVVKGRAPIAGCGYPLTLREILMQQIMDTLTDKPDWQKKIFNEVITSKWRQEILGSGEDVSEKMVDYIFDELKHKATIFSETGLVTVFDQGVIKSDTVPVTFKVALQAVVKPLEDVPDKDKDWHPGSGEKVLDLVHPSLFPLVYGLSRVLPCGRMTIEEGLAKSGNGDVVHAAGEQLPIQSKRRPIYLEPPYNRNKAYSSKFQWLPCEVDIRNEKARITSYINNLHPVHHKSLYSLIEKLIDYSIPLWEKALTSIEVSERQVRPRIKYERANYVGGWYRDLREDEGPQREEGETRDHYQPETFCPFEIEKPVRIREMFKEYGLQVIVTLANIHLTPEKPEYKGGSWHVEGQLNEHIVSTALYYYDNENIRL